jgi:hypothetical protein
MIKIISQVEAMGSFINQLEREAYDLEDYSGNNEVPVHICNCLNYLYKVQAHLNFNKLYHSEIEKYFNMAIKSLMPAVEYITDNAGDPDYAGTFYSDNVAPLLNLKHKILEGKLDYKSYKPFLAI